MQKIKSQSTLYVEKYRPQTIKDLILPDNITTLFSKFIEDGDIPNLLFSSSAGRGKTSTAQALIKELGADGLYLNGSIDNSIDTLRYQVSQFANTSSFSDNGKICFIDECLEENEEILLSDGTSLALKDFEVGKSYNVISFNMDTKETENDIGELISDRYDEVFEVELEDGRIIRMNSQHPFLVMDVDGNVVQDKLEYLKEGMEIITM